jgi:ectoine hydroxylase-related dioxygenase (phytanoyl-CoA dioxygenase family)
MSELPTPLTDAQIRSYREHGWTLASGILPPQHLDLLRSSAQLAIDTTDAEMDRLGVDRLGISHRGKRYFSENTSRQQPRLLDFIYSPLMAGICRQLLGPDVRVFWEQYVIKGAETGMSFSWHQDSGYVAADSPHPPYLTCWVALDDMSEANGTASILPISRCGIRGRVEHELDPATNDLVGYHGSDPGDPVVCPAGSIALFSSITFHRSGANTTNRMRRVYLIQYSAGRILKRDGSPWGRDEPLLVDGRLATRPVVVGDGSV